MKKTILALALTSAFILLLAACGGELPTQAPPTPRAATDIPAQPSNGKTPTRAAIASTPCAPGNPPDFIQEVVLAKDAQGANFEPVDVTDIFEPSQATFHAIVTLKNAPKNLQLGSTWYLVEAAGYKPQTINSTTLDVTDGGSRNIDFTLKGTQAAWPAGSYCVEIYADGKLATSKPFTVVAGESSAGAEIVTDIVLAESVKPDTFEPVNPTDTFKKNAEAIHAVIRVEDTPANTYVSAKWYPPDQLPLEFNLPPVDGTRWLDFRLTPPPDGFPAGEYKVEIYVNQTLVDTKTFTVQ